MLVLHDEPRCALQHLLLQPLRAGGLGVAALGEHLHRRGGALALLPPLGARRLGHRLRGGAHLWGVDDDLGDLPEIWSPMPDGLEGLAWPVDQHRALVAGDAAVVGGAEDGQEAAAVVLVEAVVVRRHLVGPHDDRHASVGEEPVGPVGPEGDEAGPARVLPHAVLLLRVRPHGVYERQLHLRGARARAGDLARADLVAPQQAQEALPGRAAGQAPVDHEDLIVHDARQRQEGENATKLLVHQLASARRPPVLAEHLAVESSTVEVHVEQAALVVAALYHHGLGPQGHEGEQQTPDLAGEVATVADVPVEEVAVAGRGRAELVEEPQHVGQLAVRVAHDDELRLTSTIIWGLGDLDRLHGPVALVPRLQHALRPVEQPEQVPGGQGRARVLLEVPHERHDPLQGDVPFDLLQARA
mmetsp:Transcript_109995/g.298295  ORF Transcript_109995/g.298295 Transcript_109995/m.298295 type:complete len:415 (-) Transcript_109995:107-1351(-)